MSTQFFLDETDIDTLINLLLRSQQSRTREALCINIGIDPKRLSFLRDSSDTDFFILLIRYLNEIDDKEALCKLCCKELFPVFKHGKYAPNLSDIAHKLNCDQKPTFPLPIPDPNKQHAKLVIGSVICLAGLLLYYILTPTPTQTPPTPTPTPTQTSTTAQGLLEHLQAVNIDHSISKSQILDWLGDSSTLYPQFAEGCLKLFGSQRLKNKVYLDVIFWKYKKLGGKVVSNSLDGSLDINILKNAIVEGYKTRNGNVSSFVDIVEQK